MKLIPFAAIVLTSLGQPVHASAAYFAPPVDWVAITQKLEGEARFSIKSVVPEIALMLERDRRLTDAIAAWGESVNFDEFAKGQIVPIDTLNALSHLVRIPIVKETLALPDGARREIVHAGIEHTYGDLFSNLTTPYGYKRARWTDYTIEKGLGLESALLNLQKPNETLFANVTVLFAKTAFRNQPKALNKLKSVEKLGSLSPSVKNFSLKGRTIITLTETAGNTTLRTDIIRFKTRSDVKPGGLLVYSVHTPKASHLITGFPVDDDFIKALSNPEALGDNKPIRTQYNLYLKNLPATGMRRLTEVSL